MLLAPCLALLLSGATEPPVPATEPFGRGSVSIEVDNSMRSYPYRLLQPDGEDTPAPLIVFLHGAGERGTDNEAQLRHFPERVLAEPHLRNKPFYLLAVQCPLEEQWAPYDAADKELGEPTPAMRAVIKAMRKVIAEYQVDTSRIYLTGLSMGGYGSWDLAARHPNWFAAVVPICGGGRHATASRLVRVPIWAFHGTEDQDIAEAESRDMIEAIRALGGTPAYTRLPGVGHGSWHAAYGPHGAIEWMFAQKKARSETPQDP